MDKTERKRLRQRGKELVERQSVELRAQQLAENPWPVGSEQWVVRYKELNRLQQEAVVRRKKLDPIPAWAARRRILAHFYVSADGVADRYNISPNQFPERAEFTSITPRELTELWALIRGINWMETLADGFGPVLHTDDDSWRIYRFPTEMTAHLATLGSSHITKLTASWAEAARFRWRREATRRVIEALSRLAHRAHNSTESLYLWISFR